MNPAVTAIANRLSLRPPQRKSLEILARLCEILPLDKSADLAASLAAVRAEFQSVTDFEREFPSFCFALATGVGKTRLMGAFIAYLHRVERINHFFVLAPNLTIYDKLITDFTPNTPKYVFQGISEFATDAPLLVTGDNYETGIGIRRDRLFDPAVHINVFNISKINAEVRGDSSPRIKRLAEYIGESYFDYLSKLDDLVMLMDESHRYRASAGLRAINELKPILGLEVTATPQIERGAEPAPFRNVVYSYPLSDAMTDGFVKEPAVATRKNFDPAAYDAARLERLKLADGIRIHEETKIALATYAHENSLPVVKPFVLVIARDVEHAETLVKAVEDDSFFSGRYRGKVITVHSNQRGEEKDDTVRLLIDVEKADNPVEIVVHVNMLREGWDVTNLYTIIPLRAANSKTLVEQSIGRGLRLPYGKRTGVDMVDRLTIVAHDRFQDIVDYANSPESVIRGGLKIVEISDERTRVVEALPEFMNRVAETPPAYGQAEQLQLFDTPRAREIARATFDVLPDFERLPSIRDLASPEVRHRIVEAVKVRLGPSQRDFEETAIDVDEVVAQAVRLFNDLFIAIPRITVLPCGDVTRRYTDFDLDVSAVRPQPVENEILIHELHRRQQSLLMSGSGIVSKEKPEDYLVRGLMDCDDVSYDDHSELLYKLAAQMVAHLRSYLKDEGELLNVLQYHQAALVKHIHAQMQSHFEDRATRYEAKVSKGFTTLQKRSQTSSQADEHDYRQPVKNRHEIRKMVFCGFKKCLYRTEKFGSDPERRFVAVLESDPDVIKWLRPSKEDLAIYYSGDSRYEPDFVVETRNTKYICEVKDAEETNEGGVHAKARAAVDWCRHASEHEERNNGKAWRYLLIPDDAIADNKTVAGFAASFAID